MHNKKHTQATKDKIRDALSGNKHPQWKGGRFHSTNGYIWIHAPSHSLASKVSPVGYVLEHRLLMCEKIGRTLKKGEVVHHINGIRDDNRIENLVLTTNSKHIAGHNSKRIWKEESKIKQQIKTSRMTRNSSGQFVKFT